MIRGFSAVSVIVLLFFISGFSQQQSPPNPLDGKYFRSPVDFPFRLSGNFCELRETHFHSGIDIKPSGHRDNPIYSIADGYVSRIKISAGGYGIAVYVDHPETGYTSVYAHLENLNEHFDFVVRQIQIAQESYEVDFLPSPDVLPVKKGDIIGEMGNTGYSFGTHLHFEIRDTKSENPINPFHFGLKTEDNIPPSLVSLSVHGLDPDLHKIWEQNIGLATSEGNAIHIASPIKVPAWRAGIALQMYDRTNGSHNKQGIYGLRMYVDDSLVYSYHMDKISFDQARYITGFYDNKIKKTNRATYSLCYKYPGNDLEFLAHASDGIIPVYAAQERKIKIVVEDFNQNHKTLTFSLLRADHMVEQAAKDSTATLVKVGEPVIISENTLLLSFEKNSLFRNIQLKIKSDISSSNETKYTIHDQYEPIKKPIALSLKPEKTNITDMNKAIIVRTNANGRGKTNYGGTWKDGVLNTGMIEFGTYFIDYDTIAPTIKRVDFSANASRKTKFRFELEENLPTRGQFVNDMKIKVWIDGNFIVSPYSSKTKILEIPLTDLYSGDHSLKIEAKDHSGNTSYFNATFTTSK